VTDARGGVVAGGRSGNFAPPVQWILNRGQPPQRENDLPLYPYRCTQCGHRFEKIQKFTDEPETVCPECGGTLERPLTAPGLQFKGAGWYVNDYAAKSGGSSSGDGAAAGEKKPETKGEGGKSEATAETKAETKSETAAGAKAKSSAPSSGSSDSSASSSSAAS